MSTALFKSNAHLDFLCKILSSEPELVPYFPQVTRYHEENQLLVSTKSGSFIMTVTACMEAWFVGFPDQRHPLRRRGH
jgi:hypothetical protein